MERFRGDAVAEEGVERYVSGCEGCSRFLYEAESRYDGYAFYAIGSSSVEERSRDVWIFERYHEVQWRLQSRQG